MSKNEIERILEETSSQINFNELKIDILRDVIILVSSDLELLDVAKSCANDDTASFQKWLDEKLVTKPTIDQIELWKKENSLFNCCIVKPFVFLQLTTLN